MKSIPRRRHLDIGRRQPCQQVSGRFAWPTIDQAVVEINAADSFAKDKPLTKM